MKKLNGLDLLNKHWHILPWHFKLKVMFITEYYFLLHKARVLRFRVLRIWVKCKKSFSPAMKQNKSEVMNT